MRSARWSIGAIFFMVAWSAAPAMAQESQPAGKLFVAAGGDAWVSPASGGHGYALAHYEREGILGAKLQATWNTDTLMLALTDYKLNARLSVSGYLKGQAAFAGLLPDYYQRGQLIEERGFWASYLQSGWVFSQSVAPHFLQLEISGRRWRFDRMEDKTSASLVLPRTKWELEPRVRYTYWDMAYDPATQQAHRHYWRVDGLAFGVELGANLRDQAQDFGAIDPASFTPDDARNHSQRALFVARAWARAGKQLSQRFRLQGMLYGASGVAQDDLVRVRAGGLNPYVVPIAGLPWATYLPDKLLSSEIALHVKVLKDSEVGLLANGALMPASDLARRAEAEGWGGVTGLGLFGDWRFGDWQLDTRVGLAPNSAWLDGDGPYLSAWLSVGKQLF